jgi:iron-sulfur cluster repair protein YtfE (RIC family)
MTGISQFLSEDHRRCDDLFVAAERAVAGEDWNTGVQCFDDFRAAAERHLAMEEQVLFAAYEAVAGAQGPSQVMRSEHEQMRALLADMTRALQERAGATYLGLSETLLILVQQHNLKEEQILYPLCDRVLANGAEDLIARMRRVSAVAVTEPA